MMPCEGHQLAWHWAAGEQEHLREDPRARARPCCAVQPSLAVGMRRSEQHLVLAGQDLHGGPEPGNERISTKDRGKLDLSRLTRKTCLQVALGTTLALSQQGALKGRSQCPWLFSSCPLPISLGISGQNGVHWEQLLSCR